MSNKTKHRSVPDEWPKEFMPAEFVDWYEHATDAELKRGIAEEKPIKPLHAMEEKELAKHILELPEKDPHRRQHEAWAKGVS